MATRRGVLAGLLAAGVPRFGWAEAGSPAFLAAAKVGDGYELHGLTASGESVFALPLPGRGHAAAAHPFRAEAVAFARRPGVFALVIDCVLGREIARLTPPEGRQFNGHGVFSADGDVLMTSEVVAEGSAGRIGVWDAQDWQRIGEWDSGGIGPHDLKLLADGRLVVANGGIATDPQDRSKLNLGEMRPNLAVLSGGEVVERVELAAGLHQNSIRHLAVMGGRVGFAMQWEGDPAEAVPQLGVWGAEGVTLCPVGEAEALVMKGYAGSIAALGDRVAVTSAPGGVVMLFDGRGAWVVTHRRADLSGVAAGAEGLVATDGQGGVWAVEDAGLRLLARHAVAWDNHLVALG
jgi:hypothetical protein